MRPERLGCWLAVVGAALLAMPVAAQEEGRPERKRPDREGRDPRARMGDPRMMMMRGNQAPAMAVSEGSLFVVLGREIKRLDADTLEEEAKANIPVAGMDDEANRKKQEQFIARFDKDKDGAIGEDEFPRPEILRKFDKNKDGKVTVDEAPGPKMMAARMPAGPSTLLVEDGNVYVFQGGALYRFDADSLELKAKAQLAPMRQGGPGMKDDRKGDRKGDREGKDRAKKKRGQDAPPEEPQVPEDPVRF